MMSFVTSRNFFLTSSSQIRSVLSPHLHRQSAKSMNGLEDCLKRMSRKSGKEAGPKVRVKIARVAAECGDVFGPVLVRHVLSSDLSRRQANMPRTLLKNAHKTHAKHTREMDDAPDRTWTRVTLRRASGSFLSVFDVFDEIKLRKNRKLTIKCWENDVR